MTTYRDEQKQKCPVCEGDGWLEDSGECTLLNEGWVHSGTIKFHCDDCGETKKKEYRAEEYRQDIYSVLDERQAQEQA